MSPDWLTFNVARREIAPALTENSTSRCERGL